MFLEYMKWMMFWIVFAAFCIFETFSDIFISFWFPFYYELKVIFIIWLVSPWTKGATIMYRKVSTYFKHLNDSLVYSRIPREARKRN